MAEPARVLLTTPWERAALVLLPLPELHLRSHQGEDLTEINSKKVATGHCRGRNLSCRGTVADLPPLLHRLDFHANEGASALFPTLGTRLFTELVPFSSIWKSPPCCA